MLFAAKYPLLQRYKLTPTVQRLPWPICRSELDGTPTPDSSSTRALHLFKVFDGASVLPCLFTREVNRALSLAPLQDFGHLRGTHLAQRDLLVEQPIDLVHALVLEIRQKAIR